MDLKTPEEELNLNQRIRLSTPHLKVTLGQKKIECFQL